MLLQACCAAAGILCCCRHAVLLQACCAAAGMLCCCRHAVLLQAYYCALTRVSYPALGCRQTALFPIVGPDVVLSAGVLDA